jgi:hypothetical protein
MIQCRIGEQQVLETLEWPDEVLPGDLNEETAVRRFGAQEIRVVYEEIEPESYLIYTVIKSKTVQRS